MTSYYQKKHMIFLGILLAGILLPFSYAVYSSGTPSPPLKGTFLQIYRHHESWPEAKWIQVFKYLKTLQMKEVVVQWVVYDDANFLPVEEGANIGNSLNYIMDLAASAGIKVWLGLIYDPQFWTKIQREAPLVEVYLRRLRLQSEATADLLVKKYPNISNWYIATEIDDKHWLPPASRQILFNYLKDLTAHLHGLMPGSRVAISGFSNARVDPATLENFWSDLLKASDIDAVFFQDGIGAEKLRISSLPLYLKAIECAVKHQGRSLSIVIELFRQTNAEPFKATSTSWESLQQQVAIAEHFAPGNLLAFSIPEYMSPLGGEMAGKLYQEYLKNIINDKCATKMENKL